MNTKTKRRMIVVTGIIVIVAVIVLAVVGGSSAAKTVSVAEARTIASDTKIQVTGNVVDNSFEIGNSTLTFDIYDSAADPAATSTLHVRYDGGVSATFGNEVTAICTGKKDASGVLVCSELVTKCPSKYESADGSLSIADLLGYGDAVIDKPVKVHGIVKTGSIGTVDADQRFIVQDQESGQELRIMFQDALANEIADGSEVVLTGSLSANGSFAATVVALEA
ncbi:MAG: cytochrome c maturation protein CcmE [Eggerthellaceae bacterium]|nr:cytochrome c maturation protein CcmE [Eggerthellaceae bacterium]